MIPSEILIVYAYASYLQKSIRYGAYFSPSAEFENPLVKNPIRIRWGNRHKGRMPPFLGDIQDVSDSQIFSCMGIS